MVFYNNMEVNTDTMGSYLESKIACVIYTNCMLNLILIIIMLAIAGYTAPLIGDASILIHDSQKTLGDLTEIIPEVKSTLHMVKQICTYENFTRHYGFLCN